LEGHIETSGGPVDERNRCLRGKKEVPGYKGGDRKDRMKGGITFSKMGASGGDMNSPQIEGEETVREEGKG